MAKRDNWRTILRVEELEPRLTPAAFTDAFDAVAPGPMPVSWAQWSSSPGTNAFAVSNALAQSPANGLAMTANASNLTARVWVVQAQTADVQVSASIYASTLIPAQVLARGSSLGSATPTFYGLSVARGLDVKLLQVVSGVSTTIGSVKSSDWVQAQWVRATIVTTGSTIQAQIFRFDKSQYLTTAGLWQNAPTFAITVSNSAIAAGNLVGLGRPSSYAGTVTFDNFSSTSTFVDNQPPTINIVSHGPGAALTGVTDVQVNAADNVGVARVEYYLDNVLHAVTTQAPFDWQFDTSSVANGLHTLMVQAYDGAGNSSQASIQVTTTNSSALPVPTIPQHYSHIRIAELAYGNPTMDSFADNLLRNSVDLVIPDPPAYDHIAAVAPNTPQLIYTNLTNIYLSRLTNWLDYANANGISPEEAFYHAANPMPFHGDSGASRPVDWFWSVYRGNFPSLVYQTETARGTQPGSVYFGNVGEYLYLGFPEPFREINLNLTSGASGGWSAALEYVKASGIPNDPSQWGTVTKSTDTTAGLTQSGQITFDPPSDWAPASLDDQGPLYYVRFRTVTGGTAPVASTILGRDYVGANGGTTGVIPAFDAAADVNHDGYLNDAEYANRAAGFNARFIYETRAFYGAYGQMRYAVNPASQAFKDWSIQYNVGYLEDTSTAAGLFIDNSNGVAPIDPGFTIEPTATFATDYAALVNELGQAIAPKWLMVNSAGGGTAADTVIQKAQSYYEEFLIRPLAHSWSQFESTAATFARRTLLTSPAPYAVLDSYPTNGSPTDPRTQIATLAYYYMLADPQTTFLDFYGGFEPTTSWDRHWSPAAAYDIGQPTGAWSLFASGIDPTNSKLTYKVYQRSFGNALVLYKPLSFGSNTTGTIVDGTATTFALGGTYAPLQADGTLGPAVTSISLRNGEGAILIRITNGAPTASAGGPYAANEGGSLTLNAGASSDPDADTLTYSWDVNGDGVYGDAAGVNPTLTWANLQALGITDGPRTYNMTVRVDDGHGHVVTSSAATFTLSDTLPNVALTGPASVNEGAAYNLTFGSIVDPGNDTVSGYSINWGDGTTDSFAGSPGGLTRSHVYTDGPSSFNIAVSVTNEDGTFAMPAKSVTVNNVVPTVTIAGPLTGVPGQTRTFTFSASDPSAPDQTAGFTYSINWGDGTLQTLSAGVSVQLDHVWMTLGTFTVAATITDKNGGAGTSLKTILIKSTDLQGTVLAVGGSPNDDTITITSADTLGNLGVTLNNVAQGTFHPTTRIVVWGLAGNDTIKLVNSKAAIAVSALIWGGAGNELIDARGSSAANVLLGEAGNDIIYGGAGNDILIGGTGTDILQGQGGDDILIGGTTLHDAYQAALEALLTEWSRTDASYATRMAHINGTLAGGLNGAYQLNTSTVLDDAAADSLFGNAGTDWFLCGVFDPNKDKLYDAVGGEIITALTH